jgi:hypothetical protein
MRYGPEVALVGRCQHPEHPATVNTKFDFEIGPAQLLARKDAPTTSPEAQVVSPFREPPSSAQRKRSPVRFGLAGLFRSTVSASTRGPDLRLAGLFVLYVKEESRAAPTTSPVSGHTTPVSTWAAPAALSVPGVGS